MTLKRTRPFLPAIVAAALALALARSAAAQAPPDPNDACLACHGDASARGATGLSVAVDATQFRSSVHGKLSLPCTGCHVGIAADTFPHGKQSPVDCATCHAKAVEEYKVTVHAQARSQGNSVAATCTNCHGSHDIRPRTDPESRVARARIPDTCGSCHANVRATWGKSQHGKLRQSNVLMSPGCTDCHSSHRIQRHDVPQWQLAVIGECGTCHAEFLTTYRDTYHGQVTALGYTRVATCASCHGAHEVLPKENPLSRVSAQNRVATCQTCHPKANANFALYDPHANKHRRDRGQTLFFAGKFMDALLLGVFVFFGAHTILWFARSLKVVRERRARGHGGTGTDSGEEH